MNEQMNERTYKRKDENYIPLSINAGGIIIRSPHLQMLYVKYGKNRLQRRSRLKMLMDGWMDDGCLPIL